ncbi:reverse transcriptase domain-containing protein [Tanacetum coccineum]
MSSPNHPTSDIEDAFSSNFPDYIPAFSNYVSASPGKTYSSFSNNSFGLVPIASPTLSLFHDDPYMKVMHAYYAEKSPISPSTIMPPSSMLSPMFNPQEFFIHEELLPLKKRGRDRSSSSTSALPQAFEIGESSRKTSLERHEEQIEEILIHLDELSLDRIEHIEDKIESLRNGQNKSSKISRMPPKRMSTSEASAMTQAAIKKLVVDSVSAALEAQAANMANTDNTTRLREQCIYNEFMSCQPINFKGSGGAVDLIRWFERTESVFSRSNCTEDCKVKFATGTLTEEALSWWNSFAQPIGIEEAYKITWVEFKKLLIKKYCPRTEVQKMEDEFYHLTVKGNDLKTYVRRFQELATLCPTMVPDSEKMMEVFIGGLPRSIEGNVTASKPQTLKEAINIAQRLMDQGCTLTLLNQPFKIDLMPIILGSFDVVIGIDWLSKYHARIICDEKVVHVPIKGETMIIRVMEKKSDEKRLEDIPVVREFPEVFPEDLPGLPLVRQVEFQIDLIPGAAPVARSPYRLAPSEMQELSDQLQELSDQGFIRPSTSP